MSVRQLDIQVSRSGVRFRKIFELNMMRSESSRVTVETETVQGLSSKCFTRLEDEEHTVFLRIGLKSYHMIQKFHSEV